MAVRIGTGPRAVGLALETLTDRAGTSIDVFEAAEQRVTGGEHAKARAEVGAAIRGDPDAIRTVWQRHRRWVAAVLLAHKPPHAELDDLIQEVAMAFVRMIGSLRDEGMLKPWLRTVAINAARAAARRHQRERACDVPVSASPASAAGADPLGQLVGHEEARRLMALAANLPDGYREPLLLKCVRGMSYRQISHIMGLPETTIETRIARGRRLLREWAQHDDQAATRSPAGVGAAFIGDGQERGGHGR